MSFAINMWLILVAAGVGPEYAAADGDWAAEITDIKKKVIDKEWREYVDKLGGEYEEVPKVTPKNDEDDPRYLKEFIDWNPTSPREVPFLAVLYVKDEGPSDVYKSYFKGEPDPGISHVEPRKACGGAMLSPTHILTVCGCLSYLISKKFGINPPLFEINDKTPQFNIENHIGASDKVPEVFVTFSLLRFVPDLKYKIDTDKAKWPKDETLNCNRLIKTDANTPDENIKAARADGQLIVVPFTPRSEVVSIYPKWPPGLPVTRDTDPFYKTYVTIASIGMRLTEKTKIKFYSSISVSSLDVKHCNVTSDVCDKNAFPDVNRVPHIELDKTHTCFCPVTKDQPPQLVRGVIGWPAVDDKGDLVGLTASERHSPDGTILVAMITELRRKLIEEYIGKQVLEDQNIPSAVYREKELKDHLLIYDYWSDQYRTVSPHAKAGATKLRNILFYFALAYFPLPCFL